MRSSTSLTPTRIIELKGKFTGEQLSKIQAEVARRELARVLDESPAEYETYVDGVRGVPIDSVRPGGKIVFRFNRVGAVLDWIYERLISRAPVKTGEYRQHIWLFINGEHVAIEEGGEPINVQPGDVAMLTDTLQYSRKLERGLSVQAPDGVFEITAREARRQFPISEIRFEYAVVATIPSMIEGGQHRRILSPHHPGAKLDRFPAITVGVGR